MNKDDEVVKGKQEPPYKNPQAIRYSLTQLVQQLFASKNMKVEVILRMIHDARLARMSVVW